MVCRLVWVLDEVTLYKVLEIELPDINIYANKSLKLVKFLLLHCSISFQFFVIFWPNNYALPCFKFSMMVGVIFGNLR